MECALWCAAVGSSSYVRNICELNRKVHKICVSIRKHLLQKLRISGLWSSKLHCCSIVLITSVHPYCAVGYWEAWAGTHLPVFQKMDWDEEN
uniref:Uncharacterized protein n=1 Tax=Pyxicephalus adspersus TaxID=30357 RepID=A0AAV3AD83_PYXAD|nr:TPA: hypothetical protein GDO54_013364 [Pyxicephalus adspersus]